MHSPFDQIAHPEKSMKEWVDSWEAFFNFGLGEKMFDVRDQDVINYAHNCIDIQALFRSPAKRLAPRYCAWTDAVINEFKAKYYWNKCVTKNEHLKVSVHIRRGDVTADRYPHMWTNTASVANTLSKARRVLDQFQLKYKISIFSQGNPEDFRHLGVSEDALFLDQDTIWTMSQLIGSDILIMGKSSFSYVAGILSDGIKLSEMCWGMKDWVSCDSEGGFDSHIFETSLLSYIGQRNRNTGPAQLGADVIADERL